MIKDLLCDRLIFMKKKVPTSQLDMSVTCSYKVDIFSLKDISDIWSQKQPYIEL